MRDAMKVRVRHIDPKVRARIRRAVLRHKLDRRFVYSATPEGYLAKVGKYSSGCSGCMSIFNPSANLGCKECGYTGKRVTVYLERLNYLYINTDKAGVTDGR